ncbi:MAG: metal-dependent hydrolase [bacterium]|nr:metal-dependent hydrolase [bacterium]
MPTILGHLFAAIPVNITLLNRRNTALIIVLSLVCAVLPDMDVMTFRLGIPYEHTFGHRGFFHSITFAAIIGLIFPLLFFPRIKRFSFQFFLLFLNFFIITASHSVLDAMTDGGLGVALFSPFSNERYFLPWRPIKVSVISLRYFFDYGGLQVLKTEFLYIIGPSILYTGLFLGIRRIFKIFKKKS